MRCFAISACLLVVNCVSADVSGFADAVIYSFKTIEDTKHFNSLLEPLASYVRDNERDITYTFRPFISDDGLSTLILERFIDRAAHDGPHSTSVVHLDFKAKVSTWNQSTQAITGKIHMDLEETSMGAFVRADPKSTKVSGFADSVLYSFKDTQSRNEYIDFLQPFATYVRDNEAEFTYTFRPFLNIDDNKSVFIVERFPNKSAHDGPHFNSSAHSEFLQKVGAWNASKHTITRKVHGDWQELSMGVINRELSRRMKTTWLNYSYVTSGWNLCNEDAGICRSLGHWVFTSAPSNLADSLVVGASFSVDDGPYVASKRGNFEAHFVNGQCSNTSDASTCITYDDGRQAQVWNIGYDVIQRGSADTLTLPRKVCAKVWTLVPATAEFGELEPLCADFETTSFTASTNILTKPDMMYSLSADAATYLCNSDRCRADGHISLDIQVMDPTQELLGLTEVSIDGGSWSSANTNTFFEQKVKHQNDKWYHTLSWNLDELMPTSSPAPKEICIKMAVQNLVTLTTWQVDFADYASYGDKNKRCLKFCNFTAPFSHAPSAGGYCPGQNKALEIIV